VETWNSSTLPVNIAAYEPRHFNTEAIQQIFGINGENFHGAKHRQDHFTGLVWVNRDY